MRRHNHAMTKYIKLDRSKCQACWRCEAVCPNDVKYILPPQWPRYNRLVVSLGVVDRAASLAWRYGLRGYAALHLASSLTWREVTGEGPVFASFDQNLHRAAGQEGLYTWPELKG